MSIGERISELRKDAGVYQSELAGTLGVSRQAVSKWETDQSCPDALNLIKLADLLDTDIEYLTPGRRNFGRRPPVVINTTVTVEKIVEKVVETPVVQMVEKPVIKKVYRTQLVRKPSEYILVGLFSFLFGLLIGYFL